MEDIIPEVDIMVCVDEKIIIPEEDIMLCEDVDCIMVPLVIICAATIVDDALQRVPSLNIAVIMTM